MVLYRSFYADTIFHGEICGAPVYPGFFLRQEDRVEDLSNQWSSPSPKRGWVACCSNLLAERRQSDVWWSSVTSAGRRSCRHFAMKFFDDAVSVFRAADTRMRGGWGMGWSGMGQRWREYDEKRQTDSSVSSLRFDCPHKETWQQPLSAG